MTREELIRLMAEALIKSMADDPKAAKWFEGEAEAILRSIEAAGFRIVPVEPTDAMLDAANKGHWEERYPVNVWADMLAASPLSASGGPDGR